MKLVFLFCALFIYGCSGSSKPATLDELKISVETAIKTKDREALNNLVCIDDTPGELVDVLHKMFEQFTQNEWITTEIKVYKFNEYEPLTDLPGSYNGKELIWSFQPSHWIIVRCKKNESFTAGLELPVKEIDGKWLIVGGRYK